MKKKKKDLPTFTALWARPLAKYSKEKTSSQPKKDNTYEAPKEKKEKVDFKFKQEK